MAVDLNDFEILITVNGLGKSEWDTWRSYQTLCKGKYWQILVKMSSGHYLRLYLWSLPGYINHNCPCLGVDGQHKRNSMVFCRLFVSCVSFGCFLSCWSFPCILCSDFGFLWVFFSLCEFLVIVGACVHVCMPVCVWVYVCLCCCCCYCLVVLKRERNGVELNG